MKILCVSDFVDPQVYSPSIKERFFDVEIVLSAGDLPMSYLDFIVSSLNKPLFFVFGNHHTKDMRHYKKTFSGPTMEFFKEHYLGCGAVHLGSKIKTEGKLIVAGLGGSMFYNDGENQFTEFQMYMEIFKLIPRLYWNKIFHGRYLDILLTHAPPKGIHDKEDKCHTGFKAFLWFMKVFKPKYLIHGHIHLYDLNDLRNSKWKNTTVINAYSHYVLETRE